MFVLNKNAQIATGEHKIHTSSCKRKPKDENAIKIGEYYEPRVALCEAKKYFFNVDGCAFCCPSIHLKR